jgi:hypothetical protein
MVPITGYTIQKNITVSTQTELSKKINGNWTIKEIIEAMKAICPESWIDESK